MQNTHDSRVLMRHGARELNPQELDHVMGALRTAVLCTQTIDPFTGNIDSDTHHC
ncbi:MAG TPA: hypothetical protein VF532_12880 [Candidatus Angelobacter sp.]